MQALTVLLAIIAGSTGYIIKVPVAPILQPTLAPSGWIHLQKLVLPLFENVCEASSDPVIVRLSQEFTTTLPSADFWDPDVITKFQNLKSGKGFLAKGQIFTDYNVEHTEELKIVFDVMRSAKTFDTFYKVAAWSRQNLNCGLYVNLIYMALENRRDTEKLTLPPPYELLPNYFIRKDIIIRGSSLLAGEEFTPSEGVRDEGNAYTLDANYTANFSDNDDESKLAYFREDIGLNSYYFLKMLKWAPWKKENININSPYGEEMYHMIKQLVARYDLERYANGLPELDDLSWDSLSDAPYDPMLVYSNGNEFIHRTSSVQLPENEDKAMLLTIENNIATVVGHMRDAGYNKTQILNHLMEILVTGERSYDTLARHLLGKALSNNGHPTVFEHFMTSLRDPMIWKMYKKIVALVDNALKALPPYTKTELYFPGVEMISIDVKKITTNFDYFEFDITEALKIGNGDTTFQVNIGQQRLNHKPFVVKLNISSLVSQKGLVKIYLGPKMMPGEFAKKKSMFNLLDSFELNLKKGSNIVTRTSNDMKMFASDFTSLKTLFNKVENAQFGLDSMPLNNMESQISFPGRLIIPKGLPEGLPLQLFVFVAPFMKTTVGEVYLTPKIEFNPAVLSPLYPLDLIMEDRILVALPNALIKDLTVTHKGSSNGNKSWNGKTNNPPLRPNMYNNGNEPFEYKAKARQFQEDDIKFSADEVSRPIADYYYETEHNDGPTTETNPSKLKASGFDFYSSLNQPYDYKSKRPQYQKPDYLSKKVDYKVLYQDKTTETPVNVKSQNELSENVLMNKNEVVDDTQEQYSNIDELNDDIMQNDDSSFGIKHYLLKSSSTDFSSTPKDSADETKYKHTKIVIPNYKKNYKNIWKTTKSPVNKIMESKFVIINEDITKKQDKEKAFNFEPRVENNYFFKFSSDDDELKFSKAKSLNMNNNVLIEDIGNIEIFKVLKDKSNVDLFSNNLSTQYDKEVTEAQDLGNENYFIFVHKDDSSKDIRLAKPDAKSPFSNDYNIHKYVMHVMDVD